MPVNIFRTKTVVLGDPGVGKTALVQMFISESREFAKNYTMTLGVDLHLKRCHIPNTSDAVEMLIYDCGGLDLYLDCLSQFWDQPDLLLLVYDVCSPTSLQSVVDWHRLAMSAEWAGGGARPVAGLLLANKTDLAVRRLVGADQGSQMAGQLGLHYVEGSAKENQGVQEAFTWLAQQLHSEVNKSQDSVRPSYNSLHKSALRSSLSNPSLK
uniref:Uncharacterized protein n=1 Tax=Cuerna arida TaxID=1464854 RepID=A0A1B6EZI4_9HEMI